MYLWFILIEHIYRIIKTATCIHQALVCMCGDYRKVFATLLGLVTSLIWDQNPGSHQYNVNPI